MAARVHECNFGIHDRNAPGMSAKTALQVTFTGSQECRFCSSVPSPGRWLSFFAVEERSPGIVERSRSKHRLVFGRERLRELPGSPRT